MSGQEWFWAISASAALLTAVGGISQAYRNNEQRKKEHRWRQAKMGKELIDQMCQDTGAGRALHLIDGIDVRLKPDTAEFLGMEARTISSQTVDAALEVPYREGEQSKEYNLVRSYFDKFFYYLNWIRKSVDSELVTFDDISTPLEYYVHRLSKKKSLYHRYLTEIKYEGVKEFLNRFQHWREKSSEPILKS